MIFIRCLLTWDYRILPGTMVELWFPKLKDEHMTVPWVLCYFFNYYCIHIQSVLSPSPFSASTLTRQDCLSKRYLILTSILSTSLAGSFLWHAGNTGLGRETCLSVAKHNHKRTFIAACNATIAESVKNDIKSLAPQLETVFVECDLGSLQTVTDVAGKINSSNERFDLHFCNAGNLGASPGLTVDGYEVHIGVNHLGRALFVQLLLPQLLETTVLQLHVRVVVTTSDRYRLRAAEGVPKISVRLSSTSRFWACWVGKIPGVDIFSPNWANFVYTAELARRFYAIKFVEVHLDVCDTTLTPA